MKTIKGGEFLVKDQESTFTPEDFNEEQLMISDLCKDFIEREVMPNLDRIDSMEEGLMESILDKAGELGLLSISIPEELGGMNMDFISSMISTEYLGDGHSSSVAIAAHTGIGTLPILYFGNKEQKEKYIPKLSTGEHKACYCLTEPNSGSDANSGKSKAVLNEEGTHYILNGQKMWITNSGFSDIFVVFAKIDNDKFLSAFIVEKGFGGITLNDEENKMGIKGSSTRQVFFNDCKVPVENLLGRRQEGFKIALNILNIGRIKLAGATLGSSKRVIKNSIQYAHERIQFGSPLIMFGAIQSKIANQIIKTYATESMIYRISDNIDQLINELVSNGISKEEATLKSIEEYAAEASMAKVYGSETLDYVVDEGVQIYGGMGFSADAPMDRAYRDSRINRIFEGTNEINRMVVVDYLSNKIQKGKLNIKDKYIEIFTRLSDGITDIKELNDTYDREKIMVENFKELSILLLSSLLKQYGDKLKLEQEVLMDLSNIIMLTYVTESVLLRVMKTNENGDILRSLIYDTLLDMKRWVHNIVHSMEGFEQMGVILNYSESLYYPINIKKAKRGIKKEVK